MFPEANNSGKGNVGPIPSASPPTRIIAFFLLVRYHNWPPVSNGQASNMCQIRAQSRAHLIDDLIIRSI